jgi:Pro-kumamolisin, activation domain/Putative Ig domain
MKKKYRFLPLVAVCLSVTALLLLTNAMQAQQTLQALHNHVRPAVANGQAVPLGLLSPNKRMDLAIQLPMRNQGEFDNLLDRLYDPKSPDYRKYLSVAQVTDQFGPTETDYQTVVDFAKANGFKVTTTANRVIVDINGTVAQINAAFHVTMMVFQHPTEKRIFYSPDREPSLDLSVPILHIAGMDNFSLPQPSVKQAPEAPKDEVTEKPSSGSGPGGLYLGEDMRAAYYGNGPLNGGPANNGSPTDFGQGVGVFEYGGYDLSDVYASFDGVPYSVPVFNVLLDGMDGLPGSGQDDVEEVLDIVQPIGMAPGLNSVHVFIGSVDADILNSMASFNCVGNSKNPQVCQELSVSWCWSPIDPSTLEPIFQTMAMQGQTILIASGDYQAYTGTNACWPAQDDYVVAVGGTDLNTTGPLGSWVSETAWPDTASGYADAGFTIPSWQVGIANAENDGSTTLRNVPDIAAEANFDNWTCHLGACQGGWGGTSFAAPRWAGFLALANQQAAIDGVGTVGFINPSIYALGEGPSYDFIFHDIVSGNNNNGVGQSFNAVTGYDLVTGWGSPNGPDLIYSLVGVDTPPTITSADTATFQVGNFGSFQMTATGFPAVVTFTTGAVLPNGVTLSPSGLLSGTPAAGTGGTYTFLVTASNGVTPNATQLFFLTVNQPPAITSANHATFQVGVFGAFTVTASGYPGSTFSTAGPLPGGVTLSSGGVLSGVPVAGSGGVYVFTITASNGISPSATQTFTLTVNQSPIITSANHATFQVGLLGTFNVTATGFPTAITFSTSGPLPSGVTLSPSGLLSGTPAAGSQGIYNFTIVASNGVAPNGTQAFTLTVDLAPTITSVNNTTFTIGLASSFVVTATGFPTPTFSTTGPLPTGITLSSTGLMSGIPAPGTAGVWHFTIVASNGALPNATQAFTLTIVKAPVTCTITSSSSTFTKGQPILFNAFVKPSKGEADTPTGTVTFIDSEYANTTLGTEPLLSGVADLTAELPTAPERQFVKAVYSGDSSFKGCTTAELTENFD